LSVKFFTHASITRKQVFIILLTSATTLLIACAAFVVYDVTTFRRKTVEQATSLAEVIGNNCTAAVDFNDSRSAEETLGALRGEPNVLGASVFKRDGTRFAHYRRATGQPPAVRAPPEPRSAHVFTSDHLILEHPVGPADEAIGTIVVIYDLAELSRRGVRYLIIVTVVFGASMLVAFILSSRLQRVISGPIQSLVQATRTVAEQKDYSVRVRKRSDDELGQLMDGFNEMLSQIQSRDVALQSARDHLEMRVRERTEQLAGSISMLNATLESTADGILAMDPHGGVTKYNLKYLEMWKISRQLPELGDDNHLLLVAALQVKDPETFLEKLRELDSNPEGRSTDTLELRDGRVFERYSQPQQVDGKFAGRVWSFRDVTERKRAEEALRERLALQERLAKIAATVPGVIHTFKLSADGTTSLPYSSPRVEEIYGLQPEDIERDASAVFNRIHPDDVPRVRASIAVSSQNMTPWRDEFRVRHPRHGEIWVEGHSMPVRDADGSLLWHGFLSNITERKRSEAKIAALNKELIETSRQAGMAEVATGVLHNVGNVLNSVNISATLVADNIKRSRAANLSRVVTLLEEHASDLGSFLTQDSRGRQLPLYLHQLADQLRAEQQKSVAELELLRKNIDHIKDIVAMQQNYAKVSGLTEKISVADLVEDALQMNAAALKRHEVAVVREFKDVPVVTVEKHKVLQILVNLIRNAKYACDDSGRTDKRLEVRISSADEGVRIAVQDNGIGIPPENLTRIFNHGFTTRKQGHGFGLHSGALAAKEMGGQLRVHSEGTGKGATFILDLPVQSAKASHV
jgi:PAS domain S-box-containing protein